MKINLLKSLLGGGATNSVKTSGAPNRQDVISLLGHQEASIDGIKEIIQHTILLDGCVQKKETVASGLQYNTADQWVVNPVHICQFNDCYVHLKTGIVYMKYAKKYCFETSWGWAKYRTASIETFNNKVYEVKTSVPVYVFSGIGYHGVVEDLSTILYLKEMGFKFKVVIDQNNFWMRQLVNVFFWGSTEVIVIHGDVWVSATHLVSTTKSGFGEFVHPDLLKTLRRWATGISDTKTFSEKVFVSRGDAGRRPYAAEPKLHKLFLKQGFEVIELGGLSVLDQINCFANASRVAGLHGAGLVNLVWCQKPVEICELYFSSHFNSCYSSIAHVLGHNYRNYQLSPDREIINKPLLNRCNGTR